MATASVTYTFVDATPAEADEVNTNFTDILTFLNNSVVHVDGTKAMTAALDAGSNKIVNLSTPTASTDAANKSYVDSISPAGRIAAFTRDTNVTVNAATSVFITPETETNDLDGWWSTGTTFTSPQTAMYLFVLVGTFASGAGNAQLTIDWDGGFQYTQGLLAAVDSTAILGSSSAVAFVGGGRTFKIKATNSSGSAIILDQITLRIIRLT